MVRCLTCNSKAYDEALARTSFDGVRIFIGRAVSNVRGITHIQLSDGERCQRWVVNYVYVVGRFSLSVDSLANVCGYSVTRFR